MLILRYRAPKASNVADDGRKNSSESSCYAYIYCYFYVFTQLYKSLNTGVGCETYA